MSADTIAPAILNYVSHGHFPPSSSPSSPNPEESDGPYAPPDHHNPTHTADPSTLATLLTTLRTAQRAAQDDLRALSRNAAPDVDAWIARAQAVQTDLVRSRDTARAIVAAAETARAVRAEAQDQERKVRLLESEVRFNEGLTATLERVGLVEGLLAAAKERVVEARFPEAMGKLTEAGRELGELAAGRIKGLLEERREGLLETLREAVAEAWRRGLEVDVEGRKLRCVSEDCGDPTAMTKPVPLEDVVSTAQELGSLKSLVENLGRGIMKAIVMPRLAVGKNDGVLRIVVRAEELACEGETDDSSYTVLFEDLRSLVEFLSQHLPPTVGKSLSETFIPSLTAKVEEEWLTPAIPLQVEEMPSFQAVFDDVLHLAGQIDAAGWHGGHALREWVQNMPRTWITKKREQILGDVRNLVFTGLRTTSTVERVETQMVSKDDALAAGTEGAEDEWDNAWDEPEEPSNEPNLPAPGKADDDDDGASAWDMDEPEDKPEAEETGGGEEDAWGWGDGEDNVPEPDSPNATKKSALKVNGQKSAQSQSEREVTLRENYSITGVPDELITLVRQVVSDAEILADAEYASLPIAPAATALYTLPTLALAIYRATAPTAYAKLGTSNMLIYNDASRLSDQLRAWQASQPPASRLRLDNDVKALDQFAKRAYSVEMESQRTILRDLLDGAQGFSNCTTVPFKAECEAAVEQTVHRLRVVHQQWTDILPQSALLQSVGSLLASVTGKMITDVEDLPDISEADSKQLKALCDSTSTVKDLFHQQSPDGNANDMTFIYCPNWLKFQYLGEIMESSLADIKYLWKEGELSLEFNAEEIVGLIEALFAESQHRRQAITEIRRSSRR